MLILINLFFIKDIYYFLEPSMFDHHFSDCGRGRDTFPELCDFVGDTCCGKFILLFILSRNYGCSFILKLMPKIVCYN